MSPEETAQRDAVIAQARTWIGTKFHHNACVKGVGVDCAMLIAAVYKDAGVRSDVIFKRYSSQWHLHQTEELYEKAIVDNGGRRLDQPTGPGEIVLYLQEKTFSHGSLIVSPELDKLRLIHAYAPSRCVVEGFEFEFPSLVGAERRFYSLW